jgi:tetratricopeptide (TPR) repeat protein
LGIALENLGRYEEAIASYDQALAIKTDLVKVLYNKAYCYALLGKTDLALENLQRAIALNPKSVRERAKTDPDFDGIREDERFRALLATDA